MSHQDWALEQKRKDTAIGRVISILEGGRHPSYTVRQREDREVNGVTSYQLILPQNYRQVALEGLHDATGHMGVDRTMALVSARFYWPQ